MKVAGQFDGTIVAMTVYKPVCMPACLALGNRQMGNRNRPIDQQEAKRLGIQVRNTPNAFTLPVADTVIGYLLALSSSTLDGRAEQAIGINPGLSLSECTLGSSASEIAAKPSAQGAALE
jgi:D-3-phosphoglycerate dehydrogenase